MTNKNLWIAVGVAAVIVVLIIIVASSGRQQTVPASPPAASLPALDVVPEATPELSPLTTSPTPSPVGAMTVAISASGFAPATLTVKVGDTVIFTNNDAANHQVASAVHPTHLIYPPLNGPVLAPGMSHTVAFTSAGTFKYHDHLNPGLTGRIVVQAE